MRAKLETWRAIAPSRGWNAWRGSVRVARTLRPRDAVHDTTLAEDPAPAEELEVVRGVSNTAWKNYPAPGRRNSPRRVIGLWVILIFAFLAIWQFLSAR